MHKNHKIIAKIKRVEEVTLWEEQPHADVWTADLQSYQLPPIEWYSAPLSNKARLLSDA